MRDKTRAFELCEKSESLVGVLVENSEEDVRDIEDMKRKDSNDASREFVIGDLHFYDPSMLPLCRPQFSSIEEMNETMITLWNSTVSDADTVFVLGDFFDFGHCTRKQADDTLDRLHGDIILIAGNHDREYLDAFREYGLDVIEYPILKDGFWILSHEPEFVTESAPYANIFAHVHLNPMYRDVSPRSFCASAERLGFTPILLNEAKRRVREMC